MRRRKQKYTPAGDDIRSENVAQELFCTKSGGGCGGYWTVSLHPGLNGLFTLVCPNCKHKHQRSVKNGRVIEDGRFSGKPIETIEATLAAFSEKPLTHDFLKGKRTSMSAEREGVVDTAQMLLRERVLEIHGAKQ